MQRILALAAFVYRLLVIQIQLTRATVYQDTQVYLKGCYCGCIQFFKFSKQKKEANVKILLIYVQIIHVNMEVYATRRVRQTTFVNGI